MSKGRVGSGPFWEQERQQNRERGPGARQAGMLARGTKTVGPNVLTVTAGLGTAPASTGQLHGQGVGAQLPPALPGLAV